MFDVDDVQQCCTIFSIQRKYLLVPPPTWKCFFKESIKDPASCLRIWTLSCFTWFQQCQIQWLIPLLSWICSRWLIKMFAGPKIADESCKCKYWPCLKSWDWLTLPQQSILLTGQNQKTSLSDTTHNLYSHVKRGSDTRGTEGQWRVVLIIATGAIGPLLSSLTCTQLEMRMKGAGPGGHRQLQLVCYIGRVKLHGRGHLDTRVTFKCEIPGSAAVGRLAVTLWC